MKIKLLILSFTLFLFASNLFAEENKKDRFEIQVSGSYMEIVDQSEAKHNVYLNVIGRNNENNSFYGFGFFFPVSDYDNAFTGQGLDMFFGSYLLSVDDFFIKGLSISVIGGGGIAYLGYEDVDADEVINVAVEILFGFELRYGNISLNMINKPMIGVEADNFLTSIVSIGYCF
jgi:hypothetical protein